MRRLIVNADDFGLTDGVNRGIAEGHERGIVTSATLMACSNRFDEATSLAKTLPRLSVGCHVVLVDGRPTATSSQIGTLVAAGSGSFQDKLMRFASRAVSGRLDAEHIEIEITAQIAKLQAAGIVVSHLDSHKHTHMFPVVLRGMLAAARRCGIRAIRNPFEPLIFAKIARWKRRFQLRMMSNFRRNFRRALDETGIIAPDGCIGVAVTGGLDQESFRQLIESLPEGTWEFVSHPGYNDRELDSVKTRLRQSRETELALLTAETSKEVLRREQVQLISYWQL